MKTYTVRLSQLAEHVPKHPERTIRHGLIYGNEVTFKEFSSVDAMHRFLSGRENIADRWKQYTLKRQNPASHRIQGKNYSNYLVKFHAGKKVSSVIIFAHSVSHAKQRLLANENFLPPSAIISATKVVDKTPRKNPGPRSGRRAHVGKRLFVICRAHSGDMLRWCVPQQHYDYGKPTQRYNLSTVLDIAKGVAFTDEVAANVFMRLHFPGLPYRIVNTLADVRRHLRMVPEKK